MIRVALYIRVSTEEQALHGISLEDQTTSLEKYARKNEYYIVGTYADEGISARKKLHKREAYQQLMQDVMLGKVDLILFTKLDRWFRNISDYYKTQEILEKHKVDWKAIYENYETTTSAGRLHVNIMLSVAQDEADRTSERIKAVFKNKIEHGEPVSGAMPYGYKLEDKKMIVIPDEAKRIKDVFETYNKLRSKYATLRYYNEKYSEQRSYDFISDMLCREFYIGKYRNNNAFCPAIIDLETFKHANDIKKSSFVRDNQTKKIYIFSGLIKCAECGCYMHGVTSDSRHATSNGDIKIYAKYTIYRCKYGAVTKTCVHNGTIREEIIENLLVNNIKDLVTWYIEEVDAKSNNIDRKKHELKIKADKTRLSKLQELFLNDLINMDSYKKEYERLNEEINTLESELNKTESTQINAESLIGIDDFKEIYDKLDRTSKRELWQKFIREIKVDKENKISVFFK